MNVVDTVTCGFLPVDIGGGVTSAGLSDKPLHLLLITLLLRGIGLSQLVRVELIRLIKLK